MSSASPAVGNDVDDVRRWAAADFQNDGLVDFGVVGYSGSATGSAYMSVLQNLSGSGLFLPYQQVMDDDDGAQGPVAVAAADLDLDGYADLACANSGSNNVTISLNLTASLTTIVGEDLTLGPGDTRLDVSCRPGPGSVKKGRCQGEIRLAATDGGAELGWARYHLRPGPGRVTLRLTKDARHALCNAPYVEALATASTDQLAGRPPATHCAPVTLVGTRSPRAHCPK